MVTAAVLVGLLILLISGGWSFVVSDKPSSSDQGDGAKPSHQHGSLAQAANPRPNILFILTDDMRASDLKYIPKTQSLLADQGVKFENAFVTRSLCCPSRATILRGQYAHNHNVWTNVNPSGGFWKFHDQGLEDSTIATWLDDAGYHTILIGKYLNPYGLDRNGHSAPITYVPPGWDKWYAWEGTYRGAGTKYDINDNGKVVTYQRSKIHDTDLYAQTAEDFIRSTAGGGAPFFMYLAPNAPHTPAYYAPRHARMFNDTPLPKPPGFDEKYVSDKPQWVQNKPLLASTRVQELTTFYRDRLRALQSVDEMVGRLVDALRDTGELSNTYIVFTSDNGIYLGEHRLTDKGAAYEEAIRIPLVVRGPGATQGAARSQIALNNDFAPTFASWAGVIPPSFVDGRSLKQLLTTDPPASWRSAFLVEHRRSAEEHAYVRDIPNYDAMRTSRYLYAEYETGEQELYDLRADPYETRSIYHSADASLREDLRARLNTLKACSGQGCRAAEDAP